MDFKDQIKQLGDRIEKLKHNIQTEEATKNAFILPFIQVMGYDVFDPLEVVPEFIADIGLKKGEKIDYAIFKDSQVIILIECKHWNQNLSLHDNQLIRYFHTSKAKFGILTNGITYRFYTDLVDANKMDETPFFEFKIDEIKDNQIEKLKEFHKSYFDLDKILNTASELKFMSALRTLINTEMAEPSDGLVRHFTKQVYTSKITDKVAEQFKGLIKKTFANLINDTINERLKLAISPALKPAVTEAAQVEGIEAPKIVTTQDELEAFYIIRGAIREIIASSRVVYRDSQTYFSVLLDDNNRKPIARVYLNGTKKYLSYFDETKKEIKVEISGMEDIYQYEVQLVASASNYLITS